MKRKNLPAILCIFMLSLICQSGHAQYSIKFTTGEFDNLCPEIPYNYVATIEPNDDNSRFCFITWDVIGGKSYPAGNTAMVEWNKTGSRSIKVSATILGETITQIKTITLEPFDYGKPSLLRIEKGETYDKYLFLDRNKNNKGKMNITLPAGLSDDREKTGTFEMVKQYDPVYTDYRFINVKYNQSQIEGNINVVSLNKCNTKGTAETVTIPSSYLDNITFNLFPANGISYGSTSAYTFSVNKKSNVTYTWSVPKGWTITSGQNTNTIQVIPSTNSIRNGQIAVTVTAFGESKIIYCPYPGIIDFKPVLSGPDFICGNTTYTLNNVIFSNEISTIWTVQSDLRIISKTNTSIVVAPSLSRGVQGDHGSESHIICAKLTNGDLMNIVHVDKPYYTSPGNLTADLKVDKTCTETSKRCVLLNINDNLPDPFSTRVSYRWSCPGGIPGMQFQVPDLPNTSYGNTSPYLLEGEMNNLNRDQENSSEFSEIETRGPSGHFGMPVNPRFATLIYPVGYSNPITITCNVTSGCSQKTASITINPAAYSSFQVGPNPADNSLEIINSDAPVSPVAANFSSNTPRYRAFLYNEFGPVKQIDIHPDDRSSSIETAGLPNGIYYLIIKNENEIIDSRVIVIQH